MTNLDSVSATAAPAFAYHRAVTDGHDRSTCRSGIIHTRMGPHTTGNRMLSVIGEAGTDSGEPQRSLEKCLPHTLPLLVPIQISAISLVKTDCRIAFTVVFKLSIINRVNIYHLTLAGRLIVHDTEPVARLDGEEVDCPGIDIFQMQNQHLRRTAAAHIIPKR